MEYLGRICPLRRFRIFTYFLFGSLPEGFEWDHINGNKLDNRRLNLRIVTRSMNKRNVKSRSNMGIQGIHQCYTSSTKEHIRYRVTLTVEGKKINSGVYKSLDEAIEVKKKIELEYENTRLEISKKIIPKNPLLVVG